LDPCDVHSSLFRTALLIVYDFLSGLRTLCIAMTELEPEEFQRWSDIYYTASTSLENREKNVDDAAELIEKVSWWSTITYDFRKGRQRVLFPRNPHRGPWVQSLSV